MNYVTLNGKKSSLIQGLLIQELPLISKPQIRVNIETIDGRDGDIVTKLGYAAYDKQLLIGLHGNYDIDEIIKYFNSEGTVTFSNEEKKYYKYQILEAIDFERLIRFKQAIVTFHVQPFKYSIAEGTPEYIIQNNSEIQINNNGNIFSKPIITLTGTGICNIYLNSVQIFSVNLNAENDDYITINTETLEAYTGAILRNRDVTGNYTDFYLGIGVNRIAFTGNVSYFTIKNYSRWL